MSKFSSYTIGYAGDYATATMQLEKPVVTMSSKPKGKYYRESFLVVTTSQLFNRESIVAAVKDALTEKDYPSYIMLLNAQSSLNSFIRENGAVNPAEAADWEDYSPSGPACTRTLEVA